MLHNIVRTQIFASAICAYAVAVFDVSCLHINRATGALGLCLGTVLDLANVLEDVGA